MRSVRGMPGTWLYNFNSKAITADKLKDLVKDKDYVLEAQSNKVTSKRQMDEH